MLNFPVILPFKTLNNFTEIKGIASVEIAGSRIENGKTEKIPPFESYKSVYAYLIWCLARIDHAVIHSSKFQKYRKTRMHRTMERVSNSIRHESNCSNI